MNFHINKQVGTLKCLILGNQLHVYTLSCEFPIRRLRSLFLHAQQPTVFIGGYSLTNSISCFILYIQIYEYHYNPFVWFFHLVCSLYECIGEIKAMYSLVLYMQCIVFGDEECVIMVLLRHCSVLLIIPCVW